MIGGLAGHGHEIRNGNVLQQRSCFCLRNRSRRIRPTFAWLIETNGSRVRKCGVTT
jgi:hypothetical protein